METNAKSKLFCQTQLPIQKMKLAVPFLLLLGLVACRPDEEVQQPVSVEHAKVLILNEGNYNFGNGSLSKYNETSKVIENKVFQANNQGRPIGDVVQSAVQIGNELFIIVNNSSKIEIVDPTTLSAIASIHQLNSPRYMVALNSSKAYVSDLYENKIYIINPSARTILGTIDTKGWIEEMTIVGKKLYAAHVDSNQVWVIDTDNDQILHKINTHEQPQFIEMDRDSNVWVSCSGGLSGGKSALYRIDHTTDSIILVLEGNASQKFGEIEMNGSKDEIYYLGEDGLYRLNINTMTPSTTPIIAKGNRLFYGFSILPKTNEIYICDAIDYQQKGVVYRYNYTGNQIDVFKVGIIPGDVFFIE